MQVEEIVRFTIERVARKDNWAVDYHSPKTRLWYVDMPRWQWREDATNRRLNWILSRFKYQNYGYTVQGAFSFFDRKTGLDTNLHALISRRSTAKAALTKKQNKLKSFVDGFTPTLFVTSIHQTQIYQLALDLIEQDKLTLAYYTECVDCEERRLAGEEVTFPPLPTHLAERDSYFKQHSVDRLA